jgi:hypothetical protein
MMENYVIGNVIVNAGLLAVAVFFIRHWMNLVEDRARINAMMIRENNISTRQELKEAIHENKAEYKSQSSEIKASIDKLSEHVATQNGRVGKIELELKEQVAACKVRQLQHRKDD